MRHDPTYRTLVAPAGGGALADIARHRLGLYLVAHERRDHSVELLQLDRVRLQPP